jgi:hypothetical protein
MSCFKRFPARSDGPAAPCLCKPHPNFQVVCSGPKMRCAFGEVLDLACCPDPECPVLIGKNGVARLSQPRSAHDRPTQKGLNPLGSADRCPLADTGHNGICRGFVKGSISVCRGLKSLTFSVGRPSLKARRSPDGVNPEPIETASGRTEEQG